MVNTHPNEENPESLVATTIKILDQELHIPAIIPSSEAKKIFSKLQKKFTTLTNLKKLRMPNYIERNTPKHEENIDQEINKIISQIQEKSNNSNKRNQQELNKLIADLESLKFSPKANAKQMVQDKQLSTVRRSVHLSEKQPKIQIQQAPEDENQPCVSSPLSTTDTQQQNEAKQRLPQIQKIDEEINKLLQNNCSDCSSFWDYFNLFQYQKLEQLKFLSIAAESFHHYLFRYKKEEDLLKFKDAYLGFMEELLNKFLEIKIANFYNDNNLASYIIQLIKILNFFIKEFLTKKTTIPWEVQKFNILFCHLCGCKIISAKDSSYTLLNIYYIFQATITDQDCKINLFFINMFLEKLTACDDFNYEHAAAVIYSLGMLGHYITGEKGIERIDKLLNFFSKYPVMENSPEDTKENFLKHIKKIFRALGILANKKLIHGQLGGDKINLIIDLVEKTKKIEISFISEMFYVLGLLARENLIKGEIRAAAINSLLLDFFSKYPVKENSPEDTKEEFLKHIKKIFRALGILADKKLIHGQLGGDKINSIINLIKKIGEIEISYVSEIFYAVGLLARENLIKDKINTKIVNHLLSFEKQNYTTAKVFTKILEGLKQLAESEVLEGEICATVINSLFQRSINSSSKNKKNIQNINTMLVTFVSLANNNGISGDINFGYVNNLLKKLSQIQDLKNQFIVNALRCVITLSRQQAESNLKLDPEIIKNLLNKIAQKDVENISPDLSTLGLLENTPQHPPTPNSAPKVKAKAAFLQEPTHQSSVSTTKHSTDPADLIKDLTKTCFLTTNQSITNSQRYSQEEFDISYNWLLSQAEAETDKNPVMIKRNLSVDRKIPPENAHFYLAGVIDSILLLFEVRFSACAMIALLYYFNNQNLTQQQDQNLDAAKNLLKNNHIEEKRNNFLSERSKQTKPNEKGNFTKAVKYLQNNPSKQQKTSTAACGYFEGIASLIILLKKIDQTGAAFILHINFFTLRNGLFFSNNKQLNEKFGYTAAIKNMLNVGIKINSLPEAQQHWPTDHQSIGFFKKPTMNEAQITTNINANLNND